MLDDWRLALVERLLSAANPAGAWGYSPGSSGSAEPTALATLALAAGGAGEDHVVGGLRWLAQVQQADGAVPISTDVDSPHWPTALAVLAWLRAAPPGESTFATQVEKAAGWLLTVRGRKVAPDPAIHDDDTTLVGWPWVRGSYSWIEPTAYAILALKAVGASDNPRVREGVRLILDRALPEGGWNYGNRRVLVHVLRPFPATTGVALTALAGESDDSSIRFALEYLNGELGRIRAPLSLAWGVIGMRAWNALPAESEAWLAVCAERLSALPATPLYDALLLLAGADACPLLPASEGRADE